MSISLRQALRLAVGPARVDAAGHAVADWFEGRNWSVAADQIREQLQDQPASDAVPHNRPDTSLRSELMAKLATHREVLLNLCDRVDRLEMRADGLTPIERVQRRWAKETAGGDKLDRLIAQIKGADEPAVQSREPASVVGEPSDGELLGLDQLEDAWNAQADAANGWNELGLDEDIVWAQRQALARWGHQPAPPGNKNTPASPESTEMNVTDFRALCVKLVEAWDSYSYADAGDAADRMAEAVEAARAALVQPAPPAEGEAGEPVAVGQPTDAQLLELYPLSMINLDDAFAFARAVLARWGHQSTPPVVGEVGDEARRLAKELRDQADDMSPALELFGLMHRAADLLEQRHAEPVPMRERPWEREGWCDERGCCWWANKYPPLRWEYVNRAAVIDGVMLPATALPLPLPLPQQETPND